MADAGWDLSVAEIIIKKPKVVFADTGLQIEPPEGYYTQIVARSSLYKSDFCLVNSIGIIDSGYRGNLMIALLYIGDGNAEDAASKLIGQRIAQLLLVENLYSEVVESASLSDSARGAGGFGSSG